VGEACPPFLFLVGIAGGHGAGAPLPTRIYGQIQISNIYSVSSPAKAGDPVFQRRRDKNREAAAYWIARSSRAMTAEGM